MFWILQHEHMLVYAVTGEVPAQGALMRWLEGRRKRLHRGSDSENGGETAE
jgi:hypothetical protein